MKCLCIDDEPLALNKLCEYVKRVPFLVLVGRASDAYTALTIMLNQRVDIIFTDINMPDLNGVEFVRSLDYKPIIVFTTAYSEYALEGFRVDALDYLLKPFSFTDFLRSANKAYKQYKLQEESREHGSTASNEAQTYFYVKADGKTIRVEYDSILYIESQGEYVRIYLINGKTVVTLLSMKSLEEYLPAKRFMRVHRSFMVNIAKVSQVANNRITLHESKVVPVSEQYKETFYTFLQRYLLSKG